MDGRLPGHLARATFIAGLAGTLGGWALAATAAAPPGTPIVLPDEALARLRDGNARFVRGDLAQGSPAAERRLAFAAFQAPFATVLSCSDSRVPPELIFDQNLGDLFIVRVAGNFADTVGLATLEYGYSALNVKLIVVLGHEGCGAVKATVDAIKTGVALPRHLDALQAGIGPGIAALAKTADYEACVAANVRSEVALLRRSQPVLAPAVEAGDLRIVGAEYTLKTGNVELLT